MSKESKPRDLANQRNRAAWDRPTDYCKGCGYYAITHAGTHRTDCTAPKDDRGTA